MKNQVVHVLLSTLYLASILYTVQAVNYSGTTEVQEGQPWSIICTGLKAGEKIIWTRNGQQFEELSSGDIRVFKPDKGVSELKAEHATELHEGSYKCTPSSNESLHLTVKTVTKIKVVTNTDVPMSLECDNHTAGEKVDWYLEGESVAEKFADKDELLKIDSNGVLTIYKNLLDVYGNYTCNTTANANSTKFFRIVPKPTAILREAENVVEGEKLHMVCKGHHYPGLKVMWEFAGKTYNNSDGRVKLLPDEERGINRAILSVDNIQMSDRGNVSCTVAYDWNDTPNHMNSTTATLRIKDKLAALWPFLGICAEVVVLCAIILIYEKKRNKSELEESDTDQSPDTGEIDKRTIKCIKNL
ncbi:neuroplastin isoform X2 [Microplitis mediator]|uniref:neuroplastin isoform X2 n=1 Tax=Microplitis mediator TaxID=375433 RepID=UPI0025570C8C|nr:neuroplastin isoform X2 [Microplitis mediator]